MKAAKSPGQKPNFADSVNGATQDVNLAITGVLKAAGATLDKYCTPPDAATVLAPADPDGDTIRSVQRLCQTGTKYTLSLAKSAVLEEVDQAKADYYHLIALDFNGMSKDNRDRLFNLVITPGLTRAAGQPVKKEGLSVPIPLTPALRYFHIPGEGTAVVWTDPNAEEVKLGGVMLKWDVQLGGK